MTKPLIIGKTYLRFVGIFTYHIGCQFAFRRDSIRRREEYWIHSPVACKATQRIRNGLNFDSSTNKNIYYFKNPSYPYSFLELLHFRCELSIPNPCVLHRMRKMQWDVVRLVGWGCNETKSITLRPEHPHLRALLQLYEWDINQTHARNCFY